MPRQPLLLLLCIAGGMAITLDAAWAGERFVGRISGSGDRCVPVALEIVIDGGRITGGGTLAVTTRTPVTVSGTRGGDGVRLVVEHRATVGDERLQRIPLIGKFLAPSRLEVWQDGDSLTCNPGRRGVLVRQ